MNKKTSKALEVFREASRAVEVRQLTCQTHYDCSKCSLQGGVTGECGTIEAGYIKAFRELARTVNTPLEYRYNYGLSTEDG